MQGRLAVNLLKRRGFATSRMLCLETASNRWADLLTQPRLDEGLDEIPGETNHAALDRPLPA